MSSAGRHVSKGAWKEGKGLAEVSDEKETQRFLKGKENHDFKGHVILLEVREIQGSACLRS